MAHTRRRKRRRNGRPLLLLTGVLAGALPFTMARAQAINAYFPTGNSGFDQQLGVTVQTRARPLYDPPGIQVGSFLVRPNLDQYLSYNTAPIGAGSPESWLSRTSASVNAGSLWSRNSLATSVGVDNYTFFSLPNSDYTDWHAGLAGSYTVGEGQIAASYSHQTYHQLGTSLGSVATATPLETQTDSAVLSSTFNFGRFSITPDVNAGMYRYGTATINGLSVNQKFLDYDSVGAGVTTRYSLSDEGSLLLVFSGNNTNYIHPQPGQPSNNSSSFLVAGGIDYQSKGLWRYQLLVGMEVREFQASQYPTRSSPIIQGNVIWTPTELTTVVGTVSRTIQSAGSAGSSGYVLSQASISVEHELRRNIFLDGRAGVQYAEYLQAGTQTNLSVGAGISWLLNRNLRLSLDYDFVRQSSPGTTVNVLNPSTSVSGSYVQNVVSMALHVAF